MSRNDHYVRSPQNQQVSNSIRDPAKSGDCLFYMKRFLVKCLDAIVQSRSLSKLNSQSLPSKPAWFHVNIPTADPWLESDDFDRIFGISTQTDRPNNSRVFSVQIISGENRVEECWIIDFHQLINAPEPAASSSPKSSSNLGNYEKLTTLIKSLLLTTRILPLFHSADPLKFSVVVYERFLQDEPQSFPDFDSSDNDWRTVKVGGCCFEHYRIGISVMYRDPYSASKSKHQEKSQHQQPLNLVQKRGVAAFAPNHLPKPLDLDKLWNYGKQIRSSRPSCQNSTIKAPVDSRTSKSNVLDDKFTQKLDDDDDNEKLQRPTSIIDSIDRSTRKSCNLIKLSWTMTPKIDETHANLINTDTLLKSILSDIEETQTKSESRLRFIDQIEASVKSKNRNKHS